MMKQYHALKKQCPDAILFYRMGDFYEMFFEDAIEASKILGIALTSRDKKKDGSIPLCGIPHHSAKMYLGRLIKQGKKVAVCEQMEDPKQAKGIVKRDIVRIITPGMVLDENLLEDSSNHFLVAVSRNGSLTALAALDLSTGDFSATQFEDDSEKLLAELTRYDPREILLPRRMEKERFLQSTSHAPITFLDDWVFETESAYQRLTEMFQTQTLEGFGCERQSGVIAAAGGILYYTQSTQKVAVDHIRGLRTYSLSDYMYMDEATQRNLELVRCTFDGKITNSLLGTIDRTNTAMGARLLKQWLLNPLVDPKTIRQRLEAVEDFILNGIERAEICKILKNIADMERLTARICMGQATARDLLQLRNTVEALTPLPENLAPLTSPMIREITSGLDLLEDIAELIRKAIRDEAPVSLKDGGIICDGYNEQVNELRQISRDSKGFIAALENTEREKTGISSLKVKFNRVFGFPSKSSSTEFMATISR
jgi:DNA mismatch repair protein MutS